MWNTGWTFSGVTPSVRHLQSKKLELKTRLPFFLLGRDVQYETLSRLVSSSSLFTVHFEILSIPRRSLKAFLFQLIWVFEKGEGTRTWEIPLNTFISPKQTNTDIAISLPRQSFRLGAKCGVPSGNMFRHWRYEGWLPIICFVLPHCCVRIIHPSSKLLSHYKLYHNLGVGKCLVVLLDVWLLSQPY